YRPLFETGVQEALAALHDNRLNLAIETLANESYDGRRNIRIEVEIERQRLPARDYVERIGAGVCPDHALGSRLNMGCEGEKQELTRCVQFGEIDVFYAKTKPQFFQPATRMCQSFLRIPVHTLREIDGLEIGSDARVTGFQSCFIGVC